MLTPQDFEATLKESFEKEIKIYPARSNWPSNAGHPCDRFLVWRRTRWQEQTTHDAGLQSVFDEGREHQQKVIDRLTKMGLEITETDRPFEYAGFSGRIDGKIKSYNGERFEKPIPLEIKTCSPYVFDALTTEEDIARSRHHYIRGYQHQMTLYLLMDNAEEGAYVFKNKLSGWLKLIPATLNWPLADALLQRFKTIDALVAERADPPPISYDEGVCGRCGFLSLCYPPRDYGEGAEMIADQGFLDMLTRHQELKPAKAEYDAIDDAISKRVKNHPLILAGDYVIEGKEIVRKGFTVQDSTQWRKTIRRVAG